jgi:hypothetical protein
VRIGLASGSVLLDMIKVRQRYNSRLDITELYLRAVRKYSLSEPFEAACVRNWTRFEVVSCDSSVV